MAKEKNEEVLVDGVENNHVARGGKSHVHIDPIADLFGNGDLNILRDKINELIANR